MSRYFCKLLVVNTKWENYTIPGIILMTTFLILVWYWFPDIAIKQAQLHKWHSDNLLETFTVTIIYVCSDTAYSNYPYNDHSAKQSINLQHLNNS